MKKILIKLHTSSYLMKIVIIGVFLGFLVLAMQNFLTIKFATIKCEKAIEFDGQNYAYLETREAENTKIRNTNYSYYNKDGWKITSEFADSCKLDSKSDITLSIENCDFIKEEKSNNIIRRYYGIKQDKRIAYMNNSKPEVSIHGSENSIEKIQILYEGTLIFFVISLLMVVGMIYGGYFYDKEILNYTNIEEESNDKK